MALEEILARARAYRLRKMTVLGALGLAAGVAALALAPDEPPPPVHLQIEVVEVEVFENPSEDSPASPLEELATP